MNHNIKRKLKSIWGLLLIGFLLIIVLPFVYIWTGVAKDHAVSVNNFKKQDEEFLMEAQGVKDAIKVFVNLNDYQDQSKMHPAFENLLISTQKLDIEINELRNSVQQKLSQPDNESDKQNTTTYLKIIDVRDRYNKKLMEFAKFGVSVNWDKPTDSQVSRLGSFSTELAAIQKELDNIENK